MVSFSIIHSKYNFVIGDAGAYAYKTRLLFEKHELRMKDSLALSLGQVFLGYVFSHIFGFSLRTLHISSYFAVFLFMISFYLLLLQFGIDRFLALIGSFTIFINPISLKFIDWYMTEAFFLLYFFIAINLYAAGIKSEKAFYFYLGAIFATISVFTRQLGVVLSLALFGELLIERKQLKRHSLHIILAGIIPILSLAILYIFNRATAAQHYAGRVSFMKGQFNSLNLIFIPFRDLLFTLHYSVIYGLPLFLVILFVAFIKKDYFNRIFLNKPWALAGAFAFVSIGTLIMLFKNHRLMPYLPSIFSIGNITNIFEFNILDKKLASILLTILTTIGGTIILAKILEEIDWKWLKRLLFGDDKTERQDIAIYFIYLTGICYFILNMITTLIYDRYIFPVAIFLILFMLLKFDWIVNFKKTVLIVFLVIYSIFIFNLAKSRKNHEALWDAGELLISQGVKPEEICGGCGFGYYHNLQPIKEMYKNVKINRPINWHKFHPMANYFLSFKKQLKDHPGLNLIYTLKRSSHFGLFEKEVYIFKRKDGYKEPIWGN